MLHSSIPFFRKRASIIGLVVCICCSQAIAAVYVGNNSSSQTISIDYSFGLVADVMLRSNQVPHTTMKEAWPSISSSKGFTITAPVNSLFAKEGSKVEYQRVNKSDMFHCTSGCDGSLPNLIAPLR